MIEEELGATASAPLVSVIMPAYNCEATIGTAIRSVLAGTHDNIQIVVCNDASTDGTRAIVEALADTRITLLHNECNRGPGASRERAIAASDGAWISFLDADDVWRPERLSHLLKATEGRGDTMAFDDILLCHHTPAGLKPWRRLHGTRAFGARSAGAVDVPTARWAATRQFVMQPLISAAALHESGVHHGNRRFQEDTEFILRLLATGLRLRYTPHADYLYRITPGSLSGVPHPGRQTREMLEDVLPLFFADPSMTRALQRKIDYRRFTEAVREREAWSIMQMALHKPRAVLELANRTLGQVRYHTSRILHGAQGR